MQKQCFAEALSSTPIVAILRARQAESLIDAAHALKDGNITLIEVTLTTPNALKIIEQARSQLGDAVVFGAGSILDAESARVAILAGAQFIVTPTLSIETISLCKRYSIPVMPGAFTPTEIQTAWEAGADMVKVFPIDALGTKFMKSVKTPLPQVKLAAVGGVSLDNVADYFKNGADAVGVGGTLINDTLLEQRNFEEITRRAKAMVETIRKL